MSKLAHNAKPISPFRLSSLLRSEKDPTLALRLFESQKPHPESIPFRYSLLSYDLLITKLGRAKMFDEMERMLHQLKQETRFSAPEPLLRKVICFYARARLFDRALSTYHSIPSFGCPRTVESLNCVLHGLFKCKKYNKLDEVFREFAKYGGPNTCTCNILIGEFCGNGRWEDAWKMFGEMLKRGIQPDVVTFGTLVNGLCLDSKVEEAFKLKDVMVRVYGLQPNRYVYTPLIKASCKTRDVSSAFRLKEELVRERIQLDSSVYSTLIHTLYNVGKSSEVPRILEEMRHNGCKPGTVTYNVMINGLCKQKDFDAAYRILDGMAKNGCKADVITYNVMIGELCKEGKLNEAKDLFEDMRRRGCTPDVVIYRILFNCMCEKKQIKEAELLLDEMVFRGYTPHYTSITKLIDELCLEGDQELLLTILNSLGKGKALSVDSWTRVVSAACSNDGFSSIGIVNRLVQDGD